MRKYEAIDLMRLFTSGSHVGWNEFLNTCVINLDINQLAKTRYQIQAGMDDLAKANLNSETIVKEFIRWDKSLIDTAKKIIRIRHPLPHDVIILNDGIERTQTALDAKRKRDAEVEDFLRKSAY